MKIRAIGVRAVSGRAGVLHSITDGMPTYRRSLPSVTNKSSGKRKSVVRNPCVSVLVCHVRRGSRVSVGRVRLLHGKNVSRPQASSE